MIIIMHCVHYTHSFKYMHGMYTYEKLTWQFQSSLLCFLTYSLTDRYLHWVLPRVFPTITIYIYIYIVRLDCGENPGDDPVQIPYQ